MKKLLTVILVIILLGAAIGGFLIYRHTSTMIGRDAAIDAALGHAGFNADQVSGLRCEKDYDDGREIYDVEFRHGGYEYNYDIDAHSYRIVEWDKDYDD